MIGDRIAGLAAVAGSGVAIYSFVIVLLRVFGRRTLGQLTVIDLVVLLVLGSAVETAMIHGDISLAAGLVSAAALLTTNRLLTWIFRRFRPLRNFLESGPILLVHNGRILHTHLRGLAMTTEDLAAALRSRGYARTEDVLAAVLETDGTFSVVANDQRSDGR